MKLLVNRTPAVVLIALLLVLGPARAQSYEASTADDTARILAGLQPSSNPRLSVLTRNPAWLSHARYFDQIFEKQGAQLSKVQEFSKEYLPDKHDTVLYMFSGPDFLYATSFFPAGTYVLAGLEPVGTIPELTSLDPWAINEELRNLEISMGSLFNFSFFITQNMKTQLREGSIYGTLPIFYVILARTGKTIREVNLVHLDEQGNVQTADELVTKKVARSAASGVKIVFSDGNGPKQTLYYFSTNLADGSFERSGFLAFLAKLGPADSLIKSASYLLHQAHFANVRRALLDTSALREPEGLCGCWRSAKDSRLHACERHVRVGHGEGHSS